MHKYISGSIAAFLVLVVPFAASAHQHATYDINGSTYQFTVGSLNEPISVDDKTGLDLTVTKGGGMPTMGPDGDMDGPPAAGKAVTGLESTLSVELIAGNQKKTLALSPAYGKEGSYTAAFYPTVATSISYHLIGTVEGNPVDLTFTCLPTGSTKAADDKTSKKLSDTVTQVSIGGAFGCPAQKETLGFPEQSASLQSVQKSARDTKSIAVAALGIAAVAFVLSVAPRFRRKVS